MESTDIDQDLNIEWNVGDGHHLPLSEIYRTSTVLQDALLESQQSQKEIIEVVGILFFQRHMSHAPFLVCAYSDQSWWTYRQIILSYFGITAGC